jgi:hypothetical protein
LLTLDANVGIDNTLMLIEPATGGADIETKRISGSADCRHTRTRLRVEVMPIIKNGRWKFLA